MAPLADGQAAEAPHRFVGLLVAEGRIGTASLVADGVAIAPAHLLFNVETGQWARDVRFYPAHHTAAPPPAEDGLRPAGIVFWPDFVDRILDEENPELRSPDTANVDLAVLYFAAGQADPRLARHAEVHVDAELAVGLLRDARDKQLAGYPFDPAFIPPEQRGLLHATSPGDYPAAWDALEELPDTWLDSGGMPTATYSLHGVTTHAGPGGYPVFARTDTDRWVLAGMVVSPIGGSSVRVRAIDERAWNLIEEAVAARGEPALRRVTDVVCTMAVETSVTLSWTDLSGGHAGHGVERLEDGAWQTIAMLDPGRAVFTDPTVQPGHVYAYRVQAVAPNGNRAPASPPLTVTTPGGNARAATALGQPWLRFASRGDSNWHPHPAGGLRAGKVRSMGESALCLNVLGPGTLGFEWGVSSEANPDYANPDSPLAGILFDAVLLYVNDEPVLDNGEPVFLSGYAPLVRREVALPEGPQRVEWRYRKNAYGSAGEDTAYLAGLTWQPAPDHPDPVYGAFLDPDSGHHAAEWFGSYRAENLPWVFHPRMGWLWLHRHPDGGTSLIGYSMRPEIGFFLSAPGLFPWVYSFSSASWQHR